MTKILIVAPSWVGDMVMSQALLKRLKERDPNAIIDVLAFKWAHPILLRMPEVNACIEMPVGHGKFNLKARYCLGRELRHQHYDVAYVLPNTWKSALIPYFANIPKRVGWLGECRWGLLNDARKLIKSHYPFMVQRYLALGFDAHGTFDAKKYYPQLKIRESDTAIAIEQYDLKTDKPILVLCPGAQYGPSKQWPSDYFARVASTCLQQGWYVWLLGGKGEKPIVQAIQSRTGNACVDLTDTTLAEAIDVMSLAHTVVSNDSGLMHVAAAVNKPLIAIYGSSSPDFTPPLSDKVEVISLTLDCKPCFKRDCPLGHHRCMKDITPERVLEKL